MFLGEYRQDFAKSSLILDTGYTAGYADTSGSRSHVFSRFYKSFIEKENETSDLEINLQHVSKSSYPKLNKLQTSLVDYLDNTLKNTIDYNYQKDDLFFNTKVSAFEDLSKTGNERFTFIYPEATLEKNLFMSDDFGIVDFKSELIVENSNVNQQVDVISNEFNWVSNSSVNNFGLENEFLGLFKNVNYKANNAEYYKTDNTVSEFYGALGFKSELGLFKFNDDKLNILKPKNFIQNFS